MTDQPSSCGNAVMGARLVYAALVTRYVERDGRGVAVIANAAYISRQMLYSVMRGDKVPSVTTVRALDTALGARGELAEMHTVTAGLVRGLNSAPDVDTHQATADDDPMERRTVIAGLAAAGVGVGSLDALERARQLISKHLDPRAEYAREDWERAPYEHAEAVVTTAPEVAQRDIALDLVELDGVMNRRGVTQDTQQVLLRSSALLASLLAGLSIRLDDVRSARRWWRTAATAAERARDVDTWVAVRGREAVMSMYMNRTPGTALTIADEVTAQKGSQAAWRGRASALGASAQAAAMMGDTQRARTALDELTDYTETIPAQWHGRNPFLWEEANTAHTVSYAATFLGDVNRARAAQKRCRELYASHDQQHGLINLHEAACIAREDLSEGAAAIARVVREHDDGQVTALARSLAGTLPSGAQARALPAYADMRNVLTAG